MRSTIGAIVISIMLLAPRAHADDWDRAVALRSEQKTGATKQEREVAQFELAVTLHELTMLQASYITFAEIARHPDHARYRETLPWLVTLAIEMDEASEIVDTIGHYDSSAIDAIQNDSMRWALDYLRGRYAYSNHAYDAALALFAKVDRRSSFYARAQIQSGMAHVLMRRANDALHSFHRVVAR